jgi:hypothetical protein
MEVLNKHRSMKLHYRRSIDIYWPKIIYNANTIQSYTHFYLQLFSDPFTTILLPWYLQTFAGYFQVPAYLQFCIQANREFEICGGLRLLTAFTMDYLHIKLFLLWFETLQVVREI